MAWLGGLLAVGTCLAQGTGVIYGTVTGASGAGVAGAKVKAVLTDRGTTRDGTTSAAGGYVFSAMPIGVYSVEVTAPGFELFRRVSLTECYSGMIRQRSGMGSRPWRTHS